MNYSPGLPQDAKHLKSYSENRAKILLESHLGVKFHSQYIIFIIFLLLKPAALAQTGKQICI